MTSGEENFGTLGDRFGDLSSVLSRESEAPLPGFELPTDRAVVTAKQLAEQVRSRGAHHASGIAGSMSPLVVRELVRLGNRVVLVVRDGDAAEEAERDLRFFLPDERSAVLSFMPSEASPYADVNPDRRGAQLRLSTLSRLLQKERPWSVLIVTAPALARKVVPGRVLASFDVTLREGDEIDRDALAKRWVAAGYVRSPIVEDPGSFALRGGLIDIWPVQAEAPGRIELYGEMVLSIKGFDPETQRTLEKIPSLFVSLARETPLTEEAVERARERIRGLCDAVDLPSVKARTLVADISSGRAFFGADGFIPAFLELEPLASYLADEEVVFVLEDPPSLTKSLRDDAGKSTADLGRKQSEPHFEISEFYVSEREVAETIAKRKHLALHRTMVVGTPSPDSLEQFETAPEDAPTLWSFDQGPLQRAIAAARSEKGKANALVPLARHLQHFEAEGLTTLIVARAENQAERLHAMLSHRGLSPILRKASDLTLERRLGRSGPALTITTGSLSRGVVAPVEGLALVTEEDIFGARSARRSKDRARAEGSKNKARAFLEDLKNVAIGDFVVHIEHGVGRYLGLIHRDVGGARVDLIQIEYAGGDKLYVPVYRLNQIEKLSGGEANPKLDRLGGSTFAKTKQKAMRAIRQIADDLLRLYAERSSVSRPAFPAPGDDYRAFEATFPFDETRDQSTAIIDVERDLEQPAPMDRLVCGDVGFGKTEVAIRAAFRVATEGKQVAILCPTTILAQQHFNAIAARMSGYPLVIRAMSRFESKGEQDGTLRGLKSGEVDIVIGTHRLLSKDVHFKRLGLVVVDEEQRFGVVHKERLKQLKTNVDVLTLSATPIPRTLQMAISGLRDMSVITTPPVDRRAIRTIVSMYDEGVLREAIVREIDRGGQVFYVHNRVEALYEKAARVAELVPSARIAVGHGQMSEAALEQTMLDFVEGRYDVLCATAIIESGLDIPRANTMIIDRADMFGLSQLYQLRGRVGRSKERAYCYLVVPPANVMTEEARSRIEALERHTELGSGFHVASLDLELRGAGDLLGADQSGVAATVGFELFTEMLQQAIAELRGQEVVHEIDPELSIDEEALLPDDYIEDISTRLSLYKRFASSVSEAEVEEIGIEMEERFGPPPDSALRFIHLMRLKIELRKMSMLGCDATKKLVSLHLAERTPLDMPKLLELVQKKKSNYKLSPDMRISRRFADGEVKGALDAIEATLGELSRCLRADA